MAILTTDQLENLVQHKYSAVSSSLLELYVMQRWWNWLVTCVPRWVAPNAITVAGLVVNVATTVPVLYYKPDCVGEAPAYTFLLLAVGVFTYQSLDAIDGKQARRTGSSSPLGELFDHGCDSISSTFIVLGAVCSMDLGPTDWLLTLSLAMATAFYCSHWESYVTGTLQFGFVDVTEGQLLVIGIHLLTYAFGVEFWAHEAFGVELKHWAAFLGIAGLAVIIARVVYTVLIVHKTASVAGTSVISPGFPAFAILYLAHYVYANSRVYQQHAVTVVFVLGFAFAKITNQLVVSQMTKYPYNLFDNAMVAPMVLALNIWLGSPLPDHIVVWATLGYSLVNLLQYCASVVSEISAYLKIDPFRIKPVKVAE